MLGTALNKHLSVRCSDWEADDLSDIQVKYAAQDAIASIAICLKLISETRMPTDMRVFSFLNIHDFYKSWAKHSAIRDIKFRMKSNHQYWTSSNNSKGTTFSANKPNKYVQLL